MPYNPAHEDILNRILTAFDSGDAEGAAACYEPDAIYHLYPEVIHGREGVKASMESWFRAFPDTRWEVKSLMSSGDTFIAEGIFRGTHTGPMDMGDGELPATGNSVELPMCFIGKVSANGMIAEDRTYLNAAMLMEQLGVS